MNLETLKYPQDMSSGVSLTSWGEVASLTLVDHLSSDGVTIKVHYIGLILYYIDQPLTSSFPTELIKTESGFIVRSVDTGSGR